MMLFNSLLNPQHIYRGEARRGAEVPDAIRTPWLSALLRGKRTEPQSGSGIPVCSLLLFFSLLIFANPNERSEHPPTVANQVSSTKSRTSPTEDWGFFAHRRINRLAIFTLDAEMMPFFRTHLEYLTEHAVDPDKRRYATKHEAVRHYIDLDHWGELPFADLPRSWVDALIWRGTLQVSEPNGNTANWKFDTIFANDPEEVYAWNSQVLLTDGDRTVDMKLADYRNFWYNSVLPNFYEDEWKIASDSMLALGIPLAENSRISVTEDFSATGILPYHLLAYHRRLTRAFASGDPARILQLAAEMGHYIGDAHVPLHTTENYNGQLSGQTGIHAFWESRLPELFADEEYDFLVGRAEYIADPQNYYWDIVLTSHALVDSVLATEKRLRETYPVDQQMCSDERLGREVKTQCAEFSRAWSDAMNGMVEERFRASILSVGSVWYSCWVDAGQPDLSLLLGNTADVVPLDTLEAAYQSGNLKGRAHD